jgi:hypothetical protein
MTRRPHLTIVIVVVALALLATITGTAAAQQADRATTTSRKPPPYAISVHLLFGRLSQTATKSFDAILGTSSGQVFGGGAELTFRNGLFVRGEASYFTANGQRVDIVDGAVVPLGIPLLLSITPIEFTGGYRLPAHAIGRSGRFSLVPIVGAGAGVLRYHEETDDAHPDERVSARHASYHLLIGVDLPVGTRVAIGAELTRRWVPGGLGSGGISEKLGDTDLGGSTLRARVRVSIF